jgi:hypothetical protein
MLYESSRLMTAAMLRILIALLFWVVLLMGCRSVPPKFAKKCGVTEKQFAEAWNDASHMKPYSARGIGGCDLIVDDVGNLFVSTPDDRQRLKAKLKLYEKRKPEKSLSANVVRLAGGSMSLAVEHEIIPEKGLAKIYYKQSGGQFCLDERGLYFNPALDLSSLPNGLKIQPSVSASKYLAMKPWNFDIAKMNSYKRLTNDSGQLVIDISGFYLNRRLLTGYIGVEFFVCSDLYNNGRNPKITPITYQFRIL